MNLAAKLIALGSSIVLLAGTWSAHVSAEETTADSTGQALDAVAALHQAEDITLKFAEKLKDHGYDTSALGPAGTAVRTVGGGAEIGSVAAKAKAAYDKGDVKGAATEVGQFALEKAKDFAIEYAAKAAAEAAEGPVVGAALTGAAVGTAIRENTRPGQKVQETEFKACQHVAVCNALLDNPKTTITINTPKRSQDAESEAKKQFSGEALKSAVNQWDQQLAEKKRVAAELAEKQRVAEQERLKEQRDEKLAEERAQREQEAAEDREDRERWQRLYDKEERDAARRDRAEAAIRRSMPPLSVPPGFQQYPPVTSPQFPFPPAYTPTATDLYPSSGGSGGTGPSTNRLPKMGYCSTSGTKACDRSSSPGNSSSPVHSAGPSDSHTEAGIRIPGAEGYENAKALFNK